MSEIVILAVCFQLKQLKKQPEKKIEAWTGLEPMTLRYRCNALSTELSSHMDKWSIVRITISLMFIRSSLLWFSYIHIHIFHYHRVYDELTYWRSFTTFHLVSLWPSISFKFYRRNISPCISSLPFVIYLTSDSGFVLYKHCISCRLVCPIFKMADFNSKRFITFSTCSLFYTLQWKSKHTLLTNWKVKNWNQNISLRYFFFWLNVVSWPWRKYILNHYGNAACSVV